MACCKLLGEQQPLLNKGQFKNLEMALGLKLRSTWLSVFGEPQGNLKPISLSMFGWMHCFLLEV